MEATYAFKRPVEPIRVWRVWYDHNPTPFFAGSDLLAFVGQATATAAGAGSALRGGASPHRDRSCLTPC